MSTHLSRLATTIVVALFVAACGSAPTPAPVSSTPATSPTSTPATTAPPTSPPPAPDQVDPLLNTAVVTVADRLRVRSEPRVSEDSVKYEPVLPIGTELLVLDGPVSASGYTWYKVAPVSFAGLQGPGNGWVAIASKEGVSWVEPVGGWIPPTPAPSPTEPSESPSASWGPLAVMPPQDGSDTARGEGTLRIGEACVYLDTGGNLLMPVWPANRATWNDETRTITFENFDGSVVTMADGDRVVLGGGGVRPKNMRWVVPPASSCKVRSYFGVGIVRDPNQTP